MSEQTPEPKEPLDVYSFMAMIADQTASIAWSKLGLQPDLITGTIHPDLGQAKAAIDVIEFLHGKIEGQLDESDRRRMRNLVTDLRMNFVEKMKEKQTG